MKKAKYRNGEEKQMDVSNGLDSGKIGVKVIFALAGWRIEGEQEKYQMLGMVTGIQKVSL